MMLEISIDGGEARSVTLSRHADGATIWIDGRIHKGTLRRLGRAYEVALDDRKCLVCFMTWSTSMLLAGPGK